MVSGSLSLSATPQVPLLALRHGDPCKECRLSGGSSADIAETIPFWHETVMPVPSPQVRYEEVRGSGSVAVRGQSLNQCGSRAQRMSERALLVAFRGMMLDGSV
jgi:hypothetical protein